MTATTGPAVTPSSRISRVLVAIAAMLMLMWPAVVNRQPFFFSDTTSYVRAADLAAHLASGGRVSTEWSSRYARDMAHPGGGDKGAAQRGNDVANGNIMSGRSPYFGVLLWLGYVASDFWLFVAAQALVAALLVRLALRMFGFGDRALLGAAAALALLTSLPFYDSMLMPDALAGFGMLAFLLLASERGRLAWGERVFLGAVMLVSALSHLTHILMIAGMAAGLAIVAWRRRDWARARTPLALAGIAVVGGLVSLMITSAVVTRVFARPPQLVPLLTSRTIEDGPGRDFILAGCDPRQFAICGLRRAAITDAVHFLWSTDPRRGVVMLVDPATRARLSAEDMRFFVAVARAYPARTVGAMVGNSVQQLADFRNLGLNTGDWDWAALPSTVHAKLAATPSGRNAWPVALLDIVHYAVVIGAVAVLAAGLLSARQRGPAGASDLALWTFLFLVGMIINDVLGGAVSIPQYRYQARIIWLVPFMGLLMGMLLHRARRVPSREMMAAAA